MFLFNVVGALEIPWWWWWWWCTRDNFCCCECQWLKTIAVVRLGHVASFVVFGGQFYALQASVEGTFAWRRL